MSRVTLEMDPYFRRIQRRLKCSRAQKRSLIERVRRAAEEFAEENPEATPEEVAEYLGNPYEVAQELLEALDPEELERYQKRKRMWLILGVGLLVVALIVMTIGFIHVTLDTQPMEVSETLVIYR